MRTINLEDLLYDEKTGIYYDSETQKSFICDVDGDIYEKESKGSIVYSNIAENV